MLSQIGRMSHLNIRCIQMKHENELHNNRLKVQFGFHFSTEALCRSQWTRGLRRVSAAARLLGLRVR